MSSGIGWMDSIRYKTMGSEVHCTSILLAIELKSYPVTRLSGRELLNPARYLLYGLVLITTCIA